MAPVHGHWIRTLWHPAVLLLALYNFLALMAEWGVTLWLPVLKFVDHRNRSLIHGSFHLARKTSP